VEATDILISVIMPVYNSEQYLAKAIESVTSQNFNNYEVILVNDGSTDGSKSICEYFMTWNKNIVLINKTNGGLCSARNKGIEKARGRYILFIDNDDEIYSDSLNIIWKAIKELKCDILRFNRTRVQIFDNKKKCKTDVYGCKNVFKNGQDKECIIRRKT
jgi:glycosyltransferase involved in cell wall biosynthesis